MSVLRRMGAFLLGLVRRIGRGLRGLLSFLIPLAAIGALGVGAYLLFIKDDETKVNYRYSNVIGGTDPVTCLFSDKKPDVVVRRGAPRGPGDQGRARTQIQLDGEAAFALEEECDGAKAQMKVESVAMTLPGVVAVRTRPTKPKGKDGKDGKKKDGGGSPTGSRKG